MLDRNDVVRTAKKLGISLDIDAVNKYYKDHPKQDDEEPTSNTEPDSNTEPEIDQDMWASTVHGGGEPHDKHNASTYKDRYFESKNRYTKYI
jgi:hypothetical protein